MNEFVGSAQLLNSYGLPTIGNGRRTLTDFADQAKNHVSKEKLQKLLTEPVSAALAENGNLSMDAMTMANQMASRYEIPVGQISECVRDISGLGKLKFNKENFSKSVLKVISIANKYLPEKYKSELFSAFLDEYSTTLAELGENVKSLEENLDRGMNLVSNNQWIFGVGTCSRYFIEIGSARYCFNAKRGAGTSVHLAVVAVGKTASLYKNEKFAGSIQLGSELLYGGNGRLSVGSRKS